MKEELIDLKYLGNYIIYDYDMFNKYHYSIDFAEDPEKVKAEKISRERERKIDLILS